MSNSETRVTNHEPQIPNSGSRIPDPGSRVPDIHPAEPRDTAQVWFDDGRVFEGSVGTPLEEFIHVAGSDPRAPTVAALIDNELRELAYRVESDVEVTPITMAHSDGFRIYRRSLAFLLVTAVQELFPEATVYVDHSLTFGGYYCQVQGCEPFSPEELARIEARMREIVEADEPIRKTRVPLNEAISLFRARGDDDKVRLLSRRRKSYLALYDLRGFRDYFHGYMVPSTGYLTVFGLQASPPGFMLRFPRSNPPMQLQPSVDVPKLLSVFREYGQWMDLMGIRDVGSLNESIAGEQAREVVLVAEALHEQGVAHIATEIAAQQGGDTEDTKIAKGAKREDAKGEDAKGAKGEDAKGAKGGDTEGAKGGDTEGAKGGQVRLVLIAGPSSSGKTTFSKRLSIQLLANGLRPFPLELDSYFVDRERTPRDEQGEYDFESLGALDVALFNDHLLRLLDGQEVTLPRYNFRRGRREAGQTVRLRPDHVVIVEGIHGLNPDLVPDIPPEVAYRIYVSALTQLNIDKHNRVPTTDTRLIRRIVRDAAYRGYSARETIERWGSVRRGEKRWIFPFQEHADVMFNSALVYELAVLKPFAEPLLLQVEPGTRAHVEAKRLLAFLEWFEPLAPDLVPDNSILLEFVGGSILRDFHVAL